MPSSTVRSVSYKVGDESDDYIYLDIDPSADWPVSIKDHGDTVSMSRNQAIELAKKILIETNASFQDWEVPAGYPACLPTS